ncbi:MAG: hypothetical protein NT003_00425 [Candidatus Magasanikbacteria bacterium]|nr:hypothetical protein [Candidatus Magasanikbacteria bacterium]
MPKKFATAVLAALILITPQFATAATKAPVKTVSSAKKATPVKKAVAKKPVKKVSKTCVECKSKAEGADKSAASKADSWKGLVIGVNEGSRGVIITEATVLNHIKAYAQRYIAIDDNTKIVTKEGEEKTFDQMDIGYSVQVTGKYDAAKRTIRAAAIEIITMPSAPITKTK